MLYDTAYGALTQLYAATSPAAAELGGQVGFLVSRHFLGIDTNTIASTSFLGPELGHLARTLMILNLGRRYGSGAKNRSRTFKMSRINGCAVSHDM
jgi:hypothetical protein